MSVTIRESCWQIHLQTIRGPATRLYCVNSPNPADIITIIFIQRYVSRLQL
jgi:hypothetical protein